MFASNTPVQVADFKLDASRLRCCTEPVSLLGGAIYLHSNNMAPAGLYEPRAAPYPAASLRPILPCAAFIAASQIQIAST